MEPREYKLSSTTSPQRISQDAEMSSKNKINVPLDSGCQDTTMIFIPKSIHQTSRESKEMSYLPNSDASHLAKWKSLINIVCMGYIFLSLIALADLGYEFSLHIYPSIPFLSDASKLMRLLGSVAVDDTDAQWACFNRFALPFIPLFAIIIAGSRQVRKRGLTALQYYHVFIGVAFIAFLHGPVFFLPIIIMLVNYVFAVKSIRYHLPHRVFMTCMWISQVGVLLFVGSNYSDYAGDQIVPLLPVEWNRGYRWSVVFNMCTLRMIAFNMDMYEAFNDGAALQEKAVRKHDTTCVECAQLRDSNRGEGSLSTRCYKFRTEYPCQMRDYNILSYMTYMLYVPLYVAGPMSSFNAFVSHLHAPTIAMTRKQMIFYACRIFVLYSIVSILLNFIFVNGVSLVDYVLAYSGAFTLYSMLYFQLAFLWLKFSCVWKLSRLAAVLDGIDVPEDMRRCFANAVSIQDFWRDWHASFNLWIVRYMYIPMGGNKKKHLNIFPIFFFIAIWHDIQPQLLYWAVSMCLCLVLELLFLRYVSKHPRVIALRKRTPVLYIILRSMFAGCSYMALLLACIVGFNSQTLLQISPAGIVEYYYTLFFIMQPFFLPWLFLFVCCCSHIGLGIRDSDAERTQLERHRLGITHGERVSKSEQQ
ncbi:Membrane bound O-acyl transferase [Trypanosoma melophagium]|uniref:Membrane bound O-acyl transferase n=1 Tax=Trypanosoma melophagium TaxID=715481 RepID=UPI00351A6C92|nr:Membrane bound O-acyl transferase [Trypanosoma melophagium]